MALATAPKYRELKIMNNHGRYPVSDNSELLYHKILQDICSARGKTYTKELQQINYGATDRQICINVVQNLQLNITPEDLEKEMQLQSKLLLPRAPLTKGIDRLLKHLRRSGVLFALATNSTRRDLRLHVATKPQFFKMFHHMVCATDPEVYRGKPFPDLYLIAAAKFPDKPQPIKCLVFEDSLLGVEAGVAAGMQVVMTPPKKLSRSKCTDATLVLDSLEQFRPEWFGLPPYTDGFKNTPLKKSSSKL